MIPQGIQEVIKVHCHPELPELERGIRAGKIARLYQIAQEDYPDLARHAGIGVELIREWKGG